jgi:hypothetical protein
VVIAISAARMSGLASGAVTGAISSRSNSIGTAPPSSIVSRADSSTWNSSSTTMSPHVATRSTGAPHRSIAVVSEENAAALAYSVNTPWLQISRASRAYASG